MNKQRKITHEGSHLFRDVMKKKSGERADITEDSLLVLLLFIFCILFIIMSPYVGGLFEGIFLILGIICFLLVVVFFVSEEKEF